MWIFHVRECNDVCMFQKYYCNSQPLNTLKIKLTAPNAIYLPHIEVMMYNASSQTLMCISRDTPATTVIWKRNGVVINDDGYKKIQIIIDGKYQNQLIGNFDIAGITCQVSNSIGSSQIYPIIGKV